MQSEQNKVLTPEQKKQMVAFAKEQFAFLKTEKGFTRPLVNQPSNGLLIYRNATIGIRIEMHFAFSSYYYDYIDVILFKLNSKGSASTIPEEGERRVRSIWLLQSLLIRQLHIENERILQVDRLRYHSGRYERGWNVEEWQEAIRLYQTLLQESIDTILQQPLDVLFPDVIEYLYVGSETFTQLVRTHFSFLQERGFQSDPIVGSDDSQTWINAERGIKLDQEMRDRYVSCTVVRLIDGKVPTYNERDLKRPEFARASTDTQLSLESLLIHKRGIADTEIAAIKNKYPLRPLYHYSDLDYTYVNTTLKTYAILVREYLAQILSAAF